MMLLSELAAVTKGELRGTDARFTSVGSDSRNIAKGQLFVAIKGDKFDGNTFAAQAVAQGAVGALVSDENVRDVPNVLVKNTRLALGELAHHWRAKQVLKMVAVTGSAGKTTVKEMIAAILRAADCGDVLATEGNLNNDIGMPLTLLKLNENHRFAVIEMGMNHEGEIRYLTHVASPDVVLVNNAGTAHIGELGSREAIARAKGEIYEGLDKDGIAIINADDDFADYWRSLNAGRKVLTFGLNNPSDISIKSIALEANQDAPSRQVVLSTPQGEINVNLQMPGEHNVRNALAAATAALALGAPLIAIQQGLGSFGGVPGRLARFAGLHGAMVVDDSYNANPDSMKAALDVLSSHSGQKIFVMGAMGELGADAPNMHAEIGVYAREKGIDTLLGLGDDTRYAVDAFGTGAQYFASLEALLEAVSGLMKRNVMVLVKGSRFMQMERVIKAIVAEELGSAH
ncbi:MAG TPA: UDP-N-acetylmuramoyl-tripeptide--D-alanyl-D-alanine ligase [Methylophilus sp.]|nr:UDP-N-acetylmuramoyl-tripeptide--D-alanyl-D-alanine ligase [Methylophilus sp.]